MDKFPSYIVKTIVGTAVREPRVLFWYQFFESYNVGEPVSNWNITKFAGLFYRDYTRKNGSWAYELCARYLPNATYNPDLPIKENISSGIVTFCFMDGDSGYNTLIIWNDRRTTQRIRVSLSSPITLHDISTGTSTVLEDESILEITREPVFITWQNDSIPRITRGTR
jgi:hypothetical protein